MRQQPLHPQGLVLLFLALLTASDVLAQAEVPKEQIPGPVVRELTELTDRFETALRRDCEAWSCYAKGCSYVAHEVVFKDGTTGLPGLGESTARTGDGQTFLTAAVCEYAFDEVEDGDKIYRQLDQRLERSLSRGVLKVRVRSSKLPRIEVPAKAATEAPPQDPLAAWTPRRALHEFWQQSLPFLPWLLSLGFATLAAILLLWAYRRVGRDDLYAKLLEGESRGGTASGAGKLIGAGHDATMLPGASRAPDRSGVVDYLAKNPAALQAIAHEWLRRGDVTGLMGLQRLVGPEGPQVLPNDLSLAQRLRLREGTTDVGHVKVDDELVARLESDIQRFRLFHDERLLEWLRICDSLAPASLAMLMSEVGPYWAALLGALLPEKALRELAPMLNDGFRLPIALAALEGIHASDADIKRLLDTTKAFVASGPAALHALVDRPDGRGAAVDGSALFSEMASSMHRSAREELAHAVVELEPARRPAWLGKAFFPQMLMAFNPLERSDLALDVPGPEFRIWLEHRLPAEERAAFVASLPPAVQVGMKAAWPTNEGIDELCARAEQRLRNAIGQRLQTGRIAFEALLLGQDSPSRKLIGGDHGS